MIELTAFANAENLKSDAVLLDIVRMSGVRFTWPGRNAFSLAIDDFSLKKGERLLLIGPSGSGKSTFLSLLAGIITPQEGAIDVLGTDIARLRGAARDRFRAEHYGIIFQMFNLAAVWLGDRQCRASVELLGQAAETRVRPPEAFMPRRGGFWTASGSNKR